MERGDTDRYAIYLDAQTTPSACETLFYHGQTLETCMLAKQHTFTLPFYVGGLKSSRPQPQMAKLSARFFPPEVGTSVISIHVKLQVILPSSLFYRAV